MKIKNILTCLFMGLVLLSCSGDDDASGNDVSIDTFRYTVETVENPGTLTRGSKVRFEVRTSSIRNSYYNVTLFLEPENGKGQNQWYFNKNFPASQFISEEVLIPESATPGNYNIGVSVQEINGSGSDDDMLNIPSYARKIKKVTIR
ncbi:hypothetical protein SAMN02927921_02588 [Sinomicrobium oceani]|uniref:DUF4625 domain-containing protein n=1 Tax=Sinomicrobium oceani TaxID=1150368 RepID=A0A1K1QJW6_9FLAO|nr:hypothetical protein [Sinomicrobium oceani]SFW59510.1 hypothetical protein SAMN02927921_02588 [Sinomicrobium oceani]